MTRVFLNVEKMVVLFFQNEWADGDDFKVDIFAAGKDITSFDRRKMGERILSKCDE